MCVCVCVSSVRYGQTSMEQDMTQIIILRNRDIYYQLWVCITKLMRLVSFSFFSLAWKLEYLYCKFM